MPVYNEEACIEAVVLSWIQSLEALSIRWQLIVLNDGSTDSTGAILNQLAKSQPGLKVVQKANSGHGPTLVQGYKMALADSDWVFQTDSDDEIKASFFAIFWNKRHEAQGLFGIREGRIQASNRKWISKVSRWVIGVGYSRAVTDVNVPFRLMQARLLKPIVDVLPEDTKTPNLIISGVYPLACTHILNIPVQHSHRNTGRVSLMSFKLLKFCIVAFWQVIVFRRTAAKCDLLR